MAALALSAGPAAMGRPVGRSQAACNAPRTSAARRLAPRRLVVAAAAEGGKLPPWESISAQLSETGIASLSPEAAYDAVELGKAVLIDVRPASDHEKAHPKGSISVPAFLVINSPSGSDFAKWLVCKANGVTPTKPNPQLAQAVAAAAAAGKAAVLACEAGGTLQASVNFPRGKESRSLKAAWRVVTAGALPVERVQHLSGGIYAWASAGLPMIGEYDGSAAGRTPAAAVSKPAKQ